MKNYDLLTPLILFMIGIMYYFLPNQKLNSSFGYRSSFAKKSEAVWIYAQKIVPIICVIGSFILVCVINAIYEFNLSLSVEIKETILKVLPLVYSMLLMVIIELELRRKFDSNGIQKKAD